MKNIFETRDITPMLISENSIPFDSEDFIYELKLDGLRCIAYLDENTFELQNKRNKILNSIFPELKNINKQVKQRCILDGELIILERGVPNFYELQRRSLMSNPVKIDLAIKKLPACYVAFDILYCGNEQITDLSLIQRKEILNETIIECPSLAISRYIDSQGVTLFKLAKEKNLEGIVGKRKDSKYYFDKRTKDWIKCKVLIDEDFVICGYYYKENNYISLILGSYLNNILIYQGHVVIGISNGDFKTISSIEKVDSEFYTNFPHFENDIWLKPQLVCTVQYMERTPKEGLRQPIFKGIREDKLPEECILK